MKKIESKIKSVVGMLDMNIVYAGEEIPKNISYSIFLAGPTPREDYTESWRIRALELLSALGYKGTVFVPEARDGKSWPSYDDNFEWELKACNVADVITFWIPRDVKKLPAFTTNVEFGYWIKSGKVVIGLPKDAPSADKNRYLDKLYQKELQEKPYDNLEDLLLNSMKKEKPSERKGAEVKVPLHIWNTKQFQSWYSQLKKAGNRLDDAEQKWVFKMPKKGLVFSYVLWVKVWIKEENRHKENEWIFSRSDISTVVLHNGKGFDSEVVLVKEFRSPSRTKDGFILENAGGSSFGDKDAVQTAIEEVKEETGLIVEPQNVKFISDRQVYGTLSTHISSCYSCKLTDKELNKAKKFFKDKKTFGVIEDTEVTYVEVYTVDELLKKDVDWHTVGTIMESLYKG